MKNAFAQSHLACFMIQDTELFLLSWVSVDEKNGEQNQLGKEGVYFSLYLQVIVLQGGKSGEEPKQRP